MISKVTICKYDIKHGMQSLYLQYSPAIRDKKTMKMTGRETLGLYIYKDPKTEEQHLHNRNKLQQAEAIRSTRVMSIINSAFWLTDNDAMQEDFLAYFTAYIRFKHQRWHKVYRHFERFTDGRCTFGDITIGLCNRFKEYLMTDARNLKIADRSLSNNCVSSYYATFRSLLKHAFVDGRLSENIDDFLESVKLENKKKEYLTLDEVKILYSTPCDVPALRAASMFAIMTGLRISDILQLEWEQIRHSEQQGGWYMSIITQKTQTPIDMPISDETLEWCGERGTGKVFKEFKRSMTQQSLKAWLERSGIKKHISFHCFRHTFAALQVAMGTDIYTVSKMLTHSHLSTTEIYADLADEKKVMSANKLTIK